ncbi:MULTISPECIES: nucleotide exchange factor GrpE [Streptomyces]|uniref:Nucleotide exchange factor GrpE n=1 Tax=Streptomyces doudnae TaxID=3075536 RepID=A0ABD5EWS5_9ACTN|nr:MULTISPECIES: nucleotide exchange factor GrpE [unclassified Streptomyces]MDT0438464.1 nucleotide exchange factor GrpE [Streptomyces sp. DSM 41981]MYQ62173.1 nucleotide exchange factor GrpE [Streptomyces sp. SID4950]SCD31973.1 GrpE protein [Streptomyces sp. SolWspMP-5a-2]
MSAGDAVAGSGREAARLGYEHTRELAARDAAHRAHRERLLLLCADALDGFDRLLADGADRDAAAYRRHLRLLAAELESGLRGEGLEPIGVVGERADPATHHVVEVRPSGSAGEDEVVEVVRRGYGDRGRLLRPAHVVVAVPGPRPGRDGAQAENSEGERE